MKKKKKYKMPVPSYVLMDHDDNWSLTIYDKIQMNTHLVAISEYMSPELQSCLLLSQVVFPIFVKAPQTRLLFFCLKNLRYLFCVLSFYLQRAVFY